MTAVTPPPPAVASNTPSRVAWLDQLRVVACLAVIAIHVSGEAYGRFTKVPSCEWWLANILNGSSRACVPVFVMISGALMKQGDSDPVLFYRKKALRFLPVILGWTILYGVFDMVVMGCSLRQVVTGFVANGYVYLHLWYLSMFAMLLVTVPYLAKMKFSAACPARDWLILAGLGVGFITIDWTLSFLSVAWGLPFNNWTRGAIPFIPYFLLGALLCELRLPLKRSVCALVLTIATMVSWMANFMTCRFVGIVSDSMPLANHSPFVLAVAVSVFLLAMAGRGGAAKSSRGWSMLGEATLGVYLLHPLFIWLINRLLRGTGCDILSGWWMVLDIPVVYAVTLGTVLLIRRFPPARRFC